MIYIVGFDPGGHGNFGWCITPDSAAMPLKPVASGLANNAHAAVQAALSAVPSNGVLGAAGIDAPLFWSRTGPRNADIVVRAAIGRAGAPHPAGTVQDVNSLRGACLAQGLLAAVMLREVYPALPLTEAHPKALRWMRSSTQAIAANSEHERDAMLSSIAAWALLHELSDWQDLYPEEPSPFTPLGGAIHYVVPR